MHCCARDRCMHGIWEARTTPRRAAAAAEMLWQQRHQVGLPRCGRQQHTLRQLQQREARQPPQWLAAVPARRTPEVFLLLLDWWRRRGTCADIFGARERRTRCVVVGGSCRRRRLCGPGWWLWRRRGRKAREHLPQQRVLPLPQHDEGPRDADELALYLQRRARLCIRPMQADQRCHGEHAAVGPAGWRDTYESKRQPANRGRNSRRQHDAAPLTDDPLRGPASGRVLPAPQHVPSSWPQSCRRRACPSRTTGRFTLPLSSMRQSARPPDDTHTATTQQMLVRGGRRKDAGDVV